MHAEEFINHDMDLTPITEFLAEAGTPSPEQEKDQQQEIQAASPLKEQTNGGRIIRRRARKACVECHKRKVRCDVLTRGQVCTNCRLDGLPCRLPAKDGRRRNQTVHPQSNAEVEVTAPQSTAPVPITTTITTEELATTGIPSFIPIRDETPSFCNAWSFRPSHQLGLSTKTTSSSSISHIDVIFSYYGFLESESLSHIPPEDFKFLENKGCFHVPSRPMLDEFIKEYFLHVHPVLPILNEGQFWNMYLDDSRLGTSTSMKLSLLLFRAILFVSCSFVSEDLLKQMGFQNAFEARLNFYRRAKLLFDFDTTSNPISIAQAALLLTYYSSDREPLANTSWLRVAVQYAQQARAHLYNQSSTMTYADRQTRKRLWWCCILRDRILPLGVRRSIQITHTTFPLHSASPLISLDLESELSNSRVYDYFTKNVLNKVLEKQVELAIILTDVLEVIYPIGPLDYNCLMKMPMQISVVRGKLEGWMTGLQSAFRESEKAMHKSVTLFLGLTEIYYHSAQAALCQYESLAHQAHPSPSSTTHTPNKALATSLHSSIASISKTVGELVQLDVAKYLPVSAVAYMALPIILNSIDLQNTKSSSGIGEKLQTKRHQLRLYTETMSLCHARYTGTGQCLRYIDQTIASAKSTIPLSPESNSESGKALSKATGNMGRNGMDDWFEAFVSKPRQYLRIALTVDIWMSVGKMAGHEDLPRVLMLEDGVVPGIGGVPRSLELGGGGVIEELVEVREGEDEKRRRDLDYFDFGNKEKGGGEMEVVEDGVGNNFLSGLEKMESGFEMESEMGSNSVENENEFGSEDSQSLDQEDWNGAMVDGILEDVLRIGSF